MAKVLRAGKDNDKPILSKAKKDYETISKSSKEESTKKPGSTMSVIKVRKMNHCFVSFKDKKIIVNFRPVNDARRGIWLAGKSQTLWNAIENERYQKLQPKVLFNCSMQLENIRNL